MHRLGILRYNYDPILVEYTLWFKPILVEYTLMVSARLYQLMSCSLACLRCAAAQESIGLSGPSLRLEVARCRIAEASVVSS